MDAFSIVHRIYFFFPSAALEFLRTVQQWTIGRIGLLCDNIFVAAGTWLSFSESKTCDSER
jgi:hypothetical protein